MPPTFPLPSATDLDGGAKASTPAAVNDNEEGNNDDDDDDDDDDENDDVDDDDNDDADNDDILSDAAGTGTLFPVACCVRQFSLHSSEYCCMKCFCCCCCCFCNVFGGLLSECCNL